MIHFYTIQFVILITEKLAGQEVGWDNILGGTVSPPCPIVASPLSISLKIIKSIKICIERSTLKIKFGNYTSEFELTVGVKREEALSSTLFNIAWEEIC